MIFVFSSPAGSATDRGACSASAVSYRSPYSSARTSSNTATATERPATIPGARETIAARPCSPGVTVATDVASTGPAGPSARSSATARRTSPMTASGSRPAASSLPRVAADSGDTLGDGSPPAGMGSDAGGGSGGDGGIRRRPTPAPWRRSRPGRAGHPRRLTYPKYPMPRMLLIAHPPRPGG